jgi:aldehyde dehydrogenase (NAD+)
MTEARYLNLVGGEWLGAASDQWLRVINPADREAIVGEVPAMTPDDVADVYAAAEPGFQNWKSHTPVERGRVLLETARLLRSRREEIARDLTAEMGKTSAEALAEVGKAADFFEYYGGLGRRAHGEALPHEARGVRVWTQQEPLGVVLAITPWNDPLLTPARKLAPALLAGNAVILKPASNTPVVAIHLAQALMDAGLPAGTVGTVTGSAREIGEALIDQPQLAAVSFTGSNQVGERLRLDLAGRNVKLLAELGGKNAAVILGDADLRTAVKTVATAAFAQAGQRCTATSRVIVDARVLPQVVELLEAAASDFVLGPGSNPDTTMGPVVSDSHRAEVLGFVDRAVEAGAELRYGGRAPDTDPLAAGSFVEPTIVSLPTTEMEIWREEVFGPVVTVSGAADLDEAIARVNDSPYGLAAGIYTTSLSAALKFADEIESGQVAVNLPTSGWDVHFPFGGFKASGSGHKEQGIDVLDFYSRTKTIAVA